MKTINSVGILSCHSNLIWNIEFVKNTCMSLMKNFLTIFNKILFLIRSITYSLLLHL